MIEKIIKKIVQEELYLNNIIVDEIIISIIPTNDCLTANASIRIELLTLDKKKHTITFPIANIYLLSGTYDADKLEVDTKLAINSLIKIIQKEYGAKYARENHNTL